LWVFSSLNIWKKIVILCRKLIKNNLNKFLPGKIEGEVGRSRNVVKEFQILNYHIHIIVSVYIKNKYSYGLVFRNMNKKEQCHQDGRLVDISIHPSSPSTQI
jgi:hypothetical protein